MRLCRHGSYPQMGSIPRRIKPKPSGNGSLSSWLGWVRSADNLAVDLLTAFDRVIILAVNTPARAADAFVFKLAKTSPMQG